MATRKIFGATLIALLLASLAYMFYGTVPIVWAGLTGTSPGETALLIIALVLCAIIFVCRTIVAVADHIERRR